MTDRELIEEVLRLDAAGTPGAWSWNRGALYGMRGAVPTLLLACADGEGPNDDNADLVARYRTAAPTLARRLAAALEVVEAARRASINPDTEDIDDPYYMLPTVDGIAIHQTLARFDAEGRGE